MAAVGFRRRSFITVFTKLKFVPTFMSGAKNVLKHSDKRLFIEAVGSTVDKHHNSPQHHVTGAKESYIKTF